MKILVVLLTLVCSGIPLQPRCCCTCELVANDVTTHGGWIREVLEGEHVVSQIRGRTLLNGDIPEEGVLVEVFDNPDVALNQSSGKKKRTQKRVAACITKQEGEFCFRGIHPGKYELRSSKRERNTTSVIVVLVREGKRNQNQLIEVPISVSN